MATKQANGQSRDISTMTAEEIEAFLKNKKVEQKKLSAEKGKIIRKELETYCEQKYGISLKQIIMSDRVKTYRNPKDGSEYIYSGFGKIPPWLKDANGKPNAAYLVN